MNPSCRRAKQEFCNNNALCDRLVTLLRLVSNKTRFRIACLLAQGEFCVHDIMDVVGEGKLSNISQQLTILRLAGIVERRRSSRRILYIIKDKRVRKLIEFLRLQYLEK
jgi:DNA-binding transcriptional ArsR family regulator